MAIDRTDFPPLSIEDFEAEYRAHRLFAAESFPPQFAIFLAKKLEKERKTLEKHARKRNAERKEPGAELDETSQSERAAK